MPAENACLRLRRELTASAVWAFFSAIRAEFQKPDANESAFIGVVRFLPRCSLGAGLVDLLRTGFRSCLLASPNPLSQDSGNLLRYTQIGGVA